MQRSDLHVVGGFDNNNRYQTPIKLCRTWVQHMLDSGVSLTLVERQTGERPYEFSKDEALFKHVNLVQLRSGPEHELWLQHPMYWKGFSTLPDGAQYLCWSDTDITYLRPDWADETLHMLQTHRVGQTWTHAIDLSPDFNIVPNDWNNEVDRSFCAAWAAGEVDLLNGPYAPKAARALLPEKETRDWRSHTGYAWAIRRDAFKYLGRPMDWQILGSADYHIAHGFAGNLRQMVENARAGCGQYSDGYYRRLIEFHNLCEQHIRQDIGCVNGTISHGWHGSKNLRFYGTRETIAQESQFDPDKDIAIDFNGLPTLCSDNRLLRDGIRRYNRRRNADSIDIYPPPKRG